MNLQQVVEHTLRLLTGEQNHEPCDEDTDRGCDQYKERNNDGGNDPDEPEEVGQPVGRLLIFKRVGHRFATGKMPAVEPPTPIPETPASAVSPRKT